MIADIESTARSIAFSKFEDDYRATCTDLQQTSITVNLDNEPKRVTAYGPQMLAHDGNSDMIGYMRLWDILLDLAPYRRTESDAAPEDQVRRKIRTIFGPIP